MIRTKKSSIFKGITYLLLVIITAVMVVPFLWMLLSSFKTLEEIKAYPLVIFPAKWQFNNFAELFARMDFFRMLGNSVFLSVVCVFGQVVSCTLVAYGFARFKNRYSDFVFSILLGTMMLPWVVTMVPTYSIFFKLGWVDTFLPFIVPSFTANALYIFLLRQFIMGIPKDLDEAAVIDGCNSFQILVKTLLPSLFPALATIVILSFNGYWSDFIGPQIYLGKEEVYTLSIGLSFFKDTNVTNIPWHLVMLGSLLFSLPILLVFFLFQRAFTEGIVMTGMKN